MLSAPPACDGPGPLGAPRRWLETKHLNRHFSKGDIQTCEKMLIVTIIREMQIKTTMRYHFIPIRMAIYIHTSKTLICK
ncbi:hypothetical protein D623_10033043 [Myotis brandtii]|uniref:Uncharacterized protein n=1 Tax=Myotis brandtii TaxID=109478 RepID=S7PT68_MYOBR|nr:hypothetical protein D623_10033043 [Myotis brandtii]